MASKDTGIVNIHGKEYKTVASRVQAFREQHGDKYSIITEIVTADEKLVVMKATVAYRVPVEGVISEQAVVATGHAEEVRSSSQINRTSALENAETSAIGRALAAFGMAGSEYASADEVANAIHQQGSAPQSAPRASSNNPPSEKQLNLIRALSRDLGIDETVFEQRISLISTSAEASEAIEKAQAALEKRKED